jgi:hypothetical protein
LFTFVKIFRRGHMDYLETILAKNKNISDELVFDRRDWVTFCFLAVCPSASYLISCKF